MCSVLGEAFTIREGSWVLPFDIRDDTESVIVAPGASFRGYEHDPLSTKNKLKGAFTSSRNANIKTIKVRIREMEKRESLKQGSTISSSLCLSYVSFRPLLQFRYESFSLVVGPL